MRIDLAVLLVPAVLWLAAGLLADGLSGAATTRRLRRRAGSLLVLVWAGLVGTGALLCAALLGDGSPVLDRVEPLLLLATAPVVLVAGRTVRRLHRLRAGAAAFSATPDTPVPPALRAAAAHPLVVLPVQLSGLLALPVVGVAVAAATGAGAPASPDTAGAGTAGLVVTVIMLVAVLTGVRHALRHSRLEERAVTLRTATPRAGGLLEV